MLLLLFSLILLLPTRQYDDARASVADEIRSPCDVSTPPVDKQPLPSAKMLQCKACGCCKIQGEGKKTFFHFLDPKKSVEDHNIGKAWLENLKNAKLPRKVEGCEWKISHFVCEDHFKSDCSEGAFRDTVSLITEFCRQEVFEERFNPDNF